MKVYVRSSTCTQDIQKFLGKDIWVKVSVDVIRYYWAKIVGQSEHFWYIIRLDTWDLGDYGKLKIEDGSEFISKISKDRFSLSYPIEAYTSAEMLDMLQPTPEGYSLAKSAKGNYYWHYDGERSDNDGIQYDVPIGYL